MRTTSVVICACVALISAGCGSVNPTQLEAPAKALLVDPEPLPKLKAGDDLVVKYAKLSRMYVSETDKRKRLIRYVKTVLQK